MNKPRNIPPEFFEVSVLKSAALILYAALLYGVGATIALVALRHSELTPLLRWPLMAGALLLASFGLGLFLWLGHEGGHGLLHPDAYASAALGIMASFPVASQSTIGFSVSDLDHHEFANRDGDPNLEIYRPFKGFWARSLLSPRRATLKYKELTRKMLRREELPFKRAPPFDKEQLYRLARLNLRIQKAWFGTRLASLIIFPLETLVAYVIPKLTSRSYNGIRPYMEHADLGNSRGRESRVRQAWLWTFLEAGNNFHQEHHLYPEVPCYKLPALHRYLKEQGFYDGANNIEPSFLGSFRYSFQTAHLPSVDSRPSRADSSV